MAQEQIKQRVRETLIAGFREVAAVANNNTALLERSRHQSLWQPECNFRKDYYQQQDQQHGYQYNHYIAHDLHNIKTCN